MAALEINNADVNTSVPYAFAKRFRLVVAERPASTLDDTDTAITSTALRILITERTPPEALLEIRRFLACPVVFDLTDEPTLDAAIMFTYERKTGAAQQAATDADETLDLTRLAELTPTSEDLLEKDDDSPIIRLINAMLSEALREGASDIHIETFETRVAVRFRVDGVLRSILEPQRALAQLLVSRIKVMARLDIAEKRLPQDGRISLRIGNREVDVRVSTIPTRHGERVVMRLLEKNTDRIDLSVLGMSDTDLVTLRQLITRPHGVVLVTGPTGSGKSTTLYAGLSALNDGSRNILTIEDPIEYDVEGVGQTQVNAKAGMSFARGLRAILRQDPDIVMIGEIRDTETADIAIQASLTGHLVLSTLHTNTAIGAVTRLLDMGVEPFLLSSSLAGLIAQRLVRQLCLACKQPYEADDATRTLLRSETIDTVNADVCAPAQRAPLVLYKAVGCSECHGLGYRGRTGVYEIISVDEALRTLIHTGAGEQALTQRARMTSTDMLQDGINKIKAGITSVDEVLRVIHAH
ncbi:MAG: ral secretion pathway protein GspE [Verrucomicrobiaceae bacterium]|nr:ral secretion pathway protein GspE [Verrucomicrobiaceae bacterium]